MASAPAVPKYLMAGHVGALRHAAVLLGLAWAARLSALGRSWRDVADLDLVAEMDGTVRVLACPAAAGGVCRMRGASS